MNEKPSSIRTWLGRYKPDRVRCTLRNGELRELPRPTTARGQWAQLEHAIALLAPSYLEAFQGNTCVASRGMEGADDDELPEAPAVVPENPMSAMVAALPTIVQLIVDAGDAGALRNQEAYKLAFESQIQANQQYLALVKVIADRLGGLERAWHKMLLDQANAQASGAEGNDAAAFSLIGNLVNGGSNGAGRAARAASASAVVDDEDKPE